MKEWFKARNIWGAAISALSDEEAGRLAKALWSYTMTGEQQELYGAEKGVLALIMMTLDLDDEESQNLSISRASAGSKGGKQRIANQANATFASDDQANQANATFASDDQANQANASNKNKNKNIEKDIEKETLLKESKEKASRFSPPSVDEVRAYCQERNNGIDAEAFVAFYASKGWKVGNSPMKDWKQCVITWEKRDVKKPVQNPVPIQTKTVVAQQYEQRDYTGVQDEILARQRDEIAERLRQKYGGSA